ncbi:MAG: hypothetical protein WCA37_04415 [Terracidiphilus sp.]
MKLQTISLLMLGLGTLGAPALNAQEAGPGMLNYVEGSVSVGGQPMNAKSAGQITLNPGETLTTDKGKAEILLTPGVFLRVDDQSAVQMISPSLTKTQMELLHGRAGVEVDQVSPANDLEILDGGVTTQLVKPGYYEFDGNAPNVMVFDGKAAVEVRDGKYKVVKSHHEMDLAPAAGAQALAKEKPVNFDPRKAQDDLYNWNSLRSEYLAEDNNEIAGQYGGGSSDPGWYWDPYAMDYTFLGAGPLWSPFGWGFYPMGWGWGGMWGGGFYGPGYYGGGYYGGGYNGGYHRYGNNVAGLGHRPVGGPIQGRGFRSVGGFHGGGYSGGGFHGGGFSGGGFHGGGGFGGGGGFHGGGGGFGGGGRR